MMEKTKAMMSGDKPETDASNIEERFVSFYAYISMVRVFLCIRKSMVFCLYAYISMVCVFLCICNMYGLSVSMYLYIYVLEELGYWSNKRKCFTELYVTM